MYFPREKREVKVKEFINLRQWKISVEEYYLKITNLSMFATSMVSNTRDDMSRFVTSVFDNVKEEFCMAMFNYYMNFFWHMVYAQ